jgi:hypothetical protein
LDLHPVQVSRKTGMRMNRSLNRKTGGSKPESVLKNYLFFLIEKIKKNSQNKWGQSHTTKNHIK